ncbi:unnamed protein product [Gordionus sp. m RMFG-2023]
MSAFESRIPSKIAGFQQPGLPLPHSDFSLIEINKAINKLKNNRAPGSDGIRNEHMKKPPMIGINQQSATSPKNPKTNISE